MAVEDIWRLQRQRRAPQGGAQADYYWTLVRSGRLGASLTLGYLPAESAERCLAGLNHLVDLRNVVLRPPDSGPQFGIPPPPDDMNAVLPELVPALQGAGPDGGYRGTWVPMNISPEFLVRLTQTGSSSEKALGRGRVRNFLERIAAAKAADQLAQHAASRTAANEMAAALDAQGPGDWPLTAYYERIWAPHCRSTRLQSWKTEEARWTGYLLPALGALPIRDIDAACFDRFIRCLKRKDCAPVSQKTRTNVTASYRALRRFAAARTHAGAHAFLSSPRGGGRTRPVPLVSEEINRLLASTSDDMHRALFACAVCIDVRPTRLLGLRWSNVILTPTEHALFGVVQFEGRDGALEPFPIDERAARHLLAWSERCAPANHGIVFRWKGKPLKGQASFRAALRNAGQRAGIDPQRLSPDLLRYSAKSMRTALPPGQGR